MHSIKITPLSVNRCWQGRRFKSPLYKNYEQELFYLLPKITIPKGKLKVSLVFGFSSKLNDIDNGVKPFIDILQKKYSFNDILIYEMQINKVDVPRGSEYIKFKIEAL